MTSINIDPILKKIGIWHIPFFLMLFARGIPLAFHILFLSFAAPKMDHWCARPDFLKDNITVAAWKEAAIPVDDSGKYAKCFMKNFSLVEGLVVFGNATQPCTEWEYDTHFYKWMLVNNFDLVCRKSWYISAAQSLFMAGIMVGNIIFAKISDTSGRRQSILYATIILIVAGLAAAISPTFMVFNIIRFVIAIGVGAYQSTIVTWSMESVADNGRAFLVLGGFGWVAGCLILPWVAYFFPNWTHQQIIFSLSILFCYVIWLILPESPRWQLASGRVNEAEKTVTSLVKKNNVKGVNVPLLFENLRNDEKKLQANGEDERSRAYKPSYADLFDKRLRTKTLAIFFLFFANRLLSFHLTFFSARMGGDPFIGFTIVNLSVLPSDFLNVLAIKKFRRKPCLIFSFLSTGAVILLLIPFDESQLMARIITTAIARNCLTLGGGVLSVFATESFPTVLRTMGIGGGYTASRVGAMLSPFFKELAEYTSPAVCAIVSAAVGIAGAVSALVLPETLHKPLPDTLDDIE